MQFFYLPDLQQDIVTLEAAEAKHCAKVLRKKVGDIIYFTDGQGTLATARLLTATPAQCVAEIVERQADYGKRRIFLHVAVAPTKNADRIEWFVEKAVEIGIEKITFLLCDHSERTTLDMARIERIAISALKQSNTTFLPAMQLVDFQHFMEECEAEDAHKLMAWCNDDTIPQLVALQFVKPNIIVLIGPEGDFSAAEIARAQASGFQGVQLGARRLRTETAALYATAIISA